jgi:hypothetical protein
LAGKVIGTETYTSPGIGALELKRLDDVIKRQPAFGVSRIHRG